MRGSLRGEGVAIAAGATTITVPVLGIGNAAREVIEEILRTTEIAVAATVVDKPRRTPAALVSWGWRLITL